MTLRIDIYHHFCDTDSGIAKLLAGFTQLEKALMKQDEAIQTLKTAFESFKADVNASLDNIAADETAILAKLGTLGDLTPANQEVIDSIVADMGALATKTKALADSIPDAPPVEG